MLTFSTSALSASGAVTWGGGGVGIGAREVGEFAGMRVIVDSQVNINVRPGTATTSEFRCYMLKSGTILEGVQQDLRIEADRNVLSKQDVISVDYHGAYHMMGTKWTSAADNPTNAQLAYRQQLDGYLRHRPDPHGRTDREHSSGRYRYQGLMTRQMALPLGGASSFLLWLPRSTPH